MQYTLWIFLRQEKNNRLYGFFIDSGAEGR